VLNGIHATDYRDEKTDHSTHARFLSFHSLEGSSGRINAKAIISSQKRLTAYDEDFCRDKQKTDVKETETEIHPKG